MSNLYKKSQVVIDDKHYVLNIPKQEHFTDGTYKPHQTARPDYTKSLPFQGTENQAENTSAELQDVNPQISITEIKSSPEYEAIFEEAQKEADSIVRNAKLSAENILVEAYEQSKGILEKSKEDGYKQGYDEGLVDSRYKFENEMNKAVQFYEQLNQEKIDFYKHNERDMIDIILSIIKRIFTDKITESENIIVDLVNQAIKEITQTNTIIVRVAEGDFDMAKKGKNIILASTDKVENIEFKMDNTLPRGSCIVESENGNIDSSLNVQFEKIERSFLALVKDNNA